MIPSFKDMVLELNDLPNVLVYESAQSNEWGVIVDRKFVIKVDSTSPSDEFLHLYIYLCSTIDVGGNPLNPHHLYRSFNKLQREIGINNILTVHDLRHTFASQFMMKGGNLYDLSKLLGHSEVKMTQRYAHLSPAHLANATQRVTFGLEEENFEFNPILTPKRFLTDVNDANKVVQNS